MSTHSYEHQRVQKRSCDQGKPIPRSNESSRTCFGPREDSHCSTTSIGSKRSKWRRKIHVQAKRAPGLVFISNSI